MSEKRFTIDYSPDVDCVSLFDNEEQTVFVMERAHVEALIEWYLKEFKRFSV
jgi:hypothetical protein